MNPPTRLLALGALAAACLAAPGCKTSMNSVERAQPHGKRAMVSDKRVLTDSSLSRKVSIVAVNDAPTPGGLLQVQVEVLNLTRSRHRFGYRFEWFDANGMQVAPASAGLHTATVEGGESRFLQSVAPTPSCQDFRLKLIEAD